MVPKDRGHSRVGDLVIFQKGFKDNEREGRRTDPLLIKKGKIIGLNGAARKV